jgi:hypothetical protein
MTPRFQADADFNHKIVLALRRREPAMDFRDPHQGGLVGLADPDVLRIASESGRILVSHDRRTMPSHFARFLESQSSAGVIIVSQDLDPGAVVEDLLLIWAATNAEEWRDRLGFVPL